METTGRNVRPPASNENPAQSTIHCVFKIRESARITAKNSQSVRFLRPNPSIRKPIQPPPNTQGGTRCGAQSPSILSPAILVYLIHPVV